jgi:hypothetical protein
LLGGGGERERMGEHKREKSFRDAKVLDISRTALLFARQALLTLSNVLKGYANMWPGWTFGLLGV